MRPSLRLMADLPVAPWRGVALGFGAVVVVGVLLTVFGVGVGRGGATWRSRVVGDDVFGSTVDEFEFCANARPAHENRTEAATKSLFIL